MNFPFSLFGALVLAAAPAALFAYLDPGTGSYFLQMLIAGLMAGLFTLKIYWKKVKSFFKKSPKEEK